ncbi:hypothetical protein GX51_01675 [Blastomyces parvus]|uniref:Uncharacterized protein n=1 Tax=Blastomyces parvus TaxID=2060905 RepID=A0A2B7XET7_9EURO|nr:hypothetical protein GX51_01675 [Blastomyces parvus]
MSSFGSAHSRAVNTVQSLKATLFMIVKHARRFPAESMAALIYLRVRTRIEVPKGIDTLPKQEATVSRGGSHCWQCDTNMPSQEYTAATATTTRIRDASAPWLLSMGQENYLPQWRRPDAWMSVRTDEFGNQTQFSTFGRP